MEEFFEDDYINHRFHDIYIGVKDGAFFPFVDELKLFNEAYYQLTRICYEKLFLITEEYNRMVEEINAHVGWGGGLDIVMGMIYGYIRLRLMPDDWDYDSHLDSILDGTDLLPDSDKDYNKMLFESVMFTIYDMHHQNFYWDLFANVHFFMNKSQKEPPLNPCPVPPEELEQIGLNWRKITHNYNEEVVAEILDLWRNAAERKKVAVLIGVELEDKQPSSAHESSQSGNDPVLLKLDKMVRDAIQEKKNKKYILLPIRAAKDAEVLPTADRKWVNERYGLNVSPKNWSDWINNEDPNYDSRELLPLITGFKKLKEGQNKGGK